MPIHDWTRVNAGIFHHFHHAWIEDIARTEGCCLRIIALWPNKLLAAWDRTS
jgi:hypothetical protein